MKWKEMSYYECRNKRRSVKSLVGEILRSRKYHKLVAAEIYGELTYMNEAEVRALQVIAKRTYEISDDAFKEFTDNVIVYSGRIKSDSKHQMIFRTDGKFENEFEPGFYDVCSNLAFELF